MDLLLNLRRTVSNFPDAPAIVDGGDVRMTWRDYDQDTRKLAAGLVELGLQPGDRIAVLALNSYRYAELYYWVIRMSGIIVPLNTRFSPAEHIYTINDSGAVALVIDEAFLPVLKTLAPHLPSVRHTLFAGTGDPLPGMLAYETLLERAQRWATFEDVQPAEDDVIGLFYTGGTTGNPKGVMLTHHNLSTSGMQVATTIPFPVPLNHLHVAPMFHLADGFFVFLVTMLGGCHTFLPAFDPAKVLATIQRERITHAVLVPIMINALLHVPNLPDYDLSSLQQVTYGASPIPVAVLKQAMELLPCRFVQAYGMTEASPVLTVHSWEAHVQGVHAEPGSPEARRLSSGGQPIIGVEVRIVDEEGKEVAAGEIGEIVARGPNVMKGYWNQAGEIAYGLRAGWLHTGDLATRDDHQFVFVVDRKKDMIISGGENVYSTEVENALYAHPAVMEAVVIGVPDPTWGERVHAVVVLKPGQQATAEELIATCRGLIAGYKVPRSLEFTDALPKSGAGKILKRALREPYWEGQARQVN